MSGLLNHTPADIVRHLLMSFGIVSLPEDSEAWPMFYKFLPDGEEVPDEVTCIYDTAGLIEGRTQNDGETIKAHGINITVQSIDGAVAYVKAVAICNAFDVRVRRNLVQIGQDEYGVSVINQTGDILPLGRNMTAKHRRHSCSINAIAVLRAIQQAGTGTGTGSGT